MAEANALNAATAGIVGNTGTSFTGTAVTAHNVLLGGASSSVLVNVAPSATSGVPLVSNGASSDPSFTTALVAGGGTGSTSFNTTGVVISGASSTTALASVTLTDGQLAIGSSAGNPAAATLSQGTGISITNGHNSITIAATTSAGVWVEIQTQSASASASLAFTTGITNTYNTYVLLYTDLVCATNSVNLELQWSTNGGSTYVTSGYTSGDGTLGSSASTWGNANTTSYNEVSNNLQNSSSNAGWIYLFSLRDGANAKMLSYSTTNDNTLALGQGYNTTATINAFQVLASSGNMTTGKFTLYGIKE